MLHAFDTLLQRIPLVQTIYGGTKKLMAVLQNKPSGLQRVVLVDFPRKGMKVVGFVTRMMIEEGTGREMAAVYIPTTPNPTGGYLEVVPVDELTPTDWTMDQAMAFIISGGAVAPDTLPASPAAHAMRYIRGSCMTMRHVLLSVLLGVFRYDYACRRPARY